jgi:hypothetical protein
VKPKLAVWMWTKSLSLFNMLRPQEQHLRGSASTVRRGLKPEDIHPAGP